jgi:hypothetical protein
MWLERLMTLPVAEGAEFLLDAVSEMAALQAEAADECAELAENAEAAEDQGEDPGAGALDDTDPQDEDAALQAPASTPVASAATASALGARAASLFAAVPTLDAAGLAHFNAIIQALSFRERMLVHELAAQRSAAELRSWVSVMLKLSVTEAVAKVRELVAVLDAAPNPFTRKDVP